MIAGASDRRRRRGLCRTEIELVRAELAHAEHDPAGAFARVFQVRQLQPCLLGASRNRKSIAAPVQASARCAQAARSRRRVGLASKVGQCNQEMASSFSARSASSGGFGDLIRAGLRQSRPRWRRAVFDRLVEQTSSIAGRRRAQSRRKAERSNTAARKSGRSPCRTETRPIAAGLVRQPRKRFPKAPAAPRQRRAAAISGRLEKPSQPRVFAAAFIYRPSRQERP